MPRLVFTSKLFLLLIPLLLGACTQTGTQTLIPTSTLTSTPPPTSTPTPFPTPTPTPDPAQSLEDANGDVFNGDWEAALQEFEMAKELAADSQILASASIGMSQVYILSGRYEQALGELNIFLSTYADYGSVADGHFLRGLAYQALGQDDLAIEDFNRYLEYRPELLLSYVEEMIGDAQRRQGRSLAAIPHYERALQAPSLGGTTGLKFKIAGSLFESGEYQAALLAYEELLQQSSGSSTNVAVRHMMGRSLQATGDLEGAYAYYLDNILNFPEADQSYQGLLTLVNAGVPVDDFQRGVVDYYAEAYEPALNAFSRVIASNPSGSAYYFQGLVRRALGDPWTAIANFQWVIDSYPQDQHWTNAWWEKSSTEWRELSDFESAIATLLNFVESAPESWRAPEALDRAAYLAEWQGFLVEAEDIWMRLAEQYPAHELAFRGAFMSGVTRFRLENYIESQDAFLLADALSNSPGERAAARFWVGKAHFAEGEIELAQESWRQAAEADPTGYYSIRASDVLEGREPFSSNTEWNFTIDWEEERRIADVWMQEQFGIDPNENLSDLGETLASDARLQRGEEFWRLGLFYEAKAEFESLRKSVSANAELSYRLLHRMLELGLYQPAIFTSRQILDLAGLDDFGTLSAPAFFNYIRFGTYYDDLIFPVAGEYDLEEALVLSVVRQESLFEGFVTSTADARGLMQVIPSTGQGIADKLGWPPGYTADDLYRPHVSVRFGIDYLAEQRDRYDGDLYAALAAYNAGSGNASAWKELAPDDPDLFFEIIRIDQPQRYIRAIYEFYGIYQFLYGGD